jgi:lipopolysaccharide/colanic/teichoic acid biosynthesis glycosyltransferase
VNLLRSSKRWGAGLPSIQPVWPENRSILDEDSFQRMISLERKRSERSRKPFLLMLLDMGENQPSPENGRILGQILAALSLATRETDTTGWYRNNAAVGVMYTELGIDDRSSIISAMMTRVTETLRKNLSLQQFSQVSISFYLFPEEWGHKTAQRSSNPTLYPDLSRREAARKFLRVVKRVMDVVGSTCALTILAPLFVAIALAIKMTSKGPVFYRQVRVGQRGVPFVCLKFRSMYLDSDPSVHKDFVRNLIAGRAEVTASNGDGKFIYKLTEDSRVTTVGKMLRRMSLDELPQFFNALKGEMSLVGPRPAISYEVDAYDIWHRSRLIEAKPGITGLWQVNGRSRVKFDDMVRLDLQYARTWSPWLDLKILIQTPKAMFSGEGAY